MRWCVVSGRNVGFHAWPLIIAVFYDWIVAAAAKCCRSIDSGFSSWPHVAVVPEISSRHRSLFSPRHCPSLNFPGSSQLNLWKRSAAAGCKAHDRG